jgi:dihydroneopterin aldolase
MDIVYIKDLRIETIIGIFDWEREVKQIISLDLEMAHDIARAADTDDIQYALNYKSISKRLITFVENSHFLLVERLAEQISRIVIEEFSVPWLRLKLSKPDALRGSKDVGIIIERGIKPYGVTD